MSSCGETRQFWPEKLKLLSMFVPFLSWAVEWSYVACCRRNVRIVSRRVGLNAGDLPRTARLERCENTVADRMPARHCPRVGRIVLELIMIERRVVDLGASTKGRSGESKVSFVKAERSRGQFLTAMCNHDEKSFNLTFVLEIENDCCLLDL